MKDGCILTVFLPKDIHQWIECERSKTTSTSINKLLYGHHNIGSCTSACQQTVVISSVPATLPRAGQHTLPRAGQHTLPRAGQHTLPKTSQHTLGSISSSGHSSHAASPSLPVWIQLTTAPRSLLAFISINGKMLDLKYVHLILYCPSEVSKSNLLQLKYNNPDTDKVSYLLSRLRQDVHVSQHAKHTRVLFKILDVVTCALLVIMFIPNLLVRIQATFETVSGYRISVLDQITTRVEQLREIRKLLQIVQCDETNKGSYKSCGKLGDDATGRSSCCPKLVLGRLTCAVAADLLLGAVLLYTTLTILSADDLTTMFADMTQWVSSSVLQLLEWLRGAPAGLKLNQPLTRALATFFSYHVGLWMLYLDVAGSALYVLCCTVLCAGLLGTSVQVALFCDILHFATLHLHCFYVYAARLHMVQVSVLGSQWRAFRGHKWNPLKNRLDSLLPPTHRRGATLAQSSLARVLTAVIFTLVVFLLPTTTIYYSVFLTLRLLLYVSRGGLNALVWLIHHNPLYLVVLYLTNSRHIKGDVHFRIVAPNDQLQLLLELNLTSVGLMEALTVFSPSWTLPRLYTLRATHLLDAILYAKHLL